MIRARSLAGCAALFSVLASVSAFASDSGRIELRADIGGEPFPPFDARVATETRQAFAPSGRLSLGLKPSQIATGGRVFVYGRVPSALIGTPFTAEALIWTAGRPEQGEEEAVEMGWRRAGLIESGGGSAFVSETLVVEKLDPGAVATEVAKRTPPPGGGVTVRSMPVRVPRSGRLRIGYSLDERVWEGLVPVTVEVLARRVRDGIVADEATSLFRQHVVPAKQPPRWFDHVLDLRGVAGSEAVFEFRASSESAPGKLQPHVVWSVPEIVYNTGRSGAPAVVVVSLGNVRASSLSCCGADRETSPFMQSLFGNQGVIFDRAIASSVETIPAHMSLLTGVYPSVHGVLTAKVSADPHYRSVAEVFVDGGGLAPELGFGRGFDRYVENPALDPWDASGRAGPTFAAAVEWIEKHGNEPFFVFIQTSQARAPYVPPAAYLEYFKDARLSTPSDLDEGALVRYERDIRYVDDVLRDFVVKLDRFVDPDSLLLVVTSGHGEAFLEHGALGHGTELYDETVRVPLLMRGLGLRPGARYSEVVSTIDVGPTVLELAGQRVPGTMQGESIAKALASGLPYSLPPRFMEAHGRKRRLAEGFDENWKPPSYGVVEGMRKLIRNAGEEGSAPEAFNVLADPEELTNLAGEGAPAWVAEFEGLVDSYPTACRRIARPPAQAPEIDPRTRLKLRAFGYID